MRIEMLDRTVADLVAGYRDDGEGGRTIESNCQMLCRPCNRKKAAQ